MDDIFAPPTQDELNSVKTQSSDNSNLYAPPTDDEIKSVTPTGNLEAIGRGLESDIKPIYEGGKALIQNRPFSDVANEEESNLNKAWNDNPWAYGAGKVGGIAGEAALAPEALGDVATNAGISALGSNWSKPAEAIGQTALGGVTGGVLGKAGELYNKSGIPEKMANDLLGTEANPEALNIVKNTPFSRTVSDTMENLKGTATQMKQQLNEDLANEYEKYKPIVANEKADKDFLNTNLMNLRNKATDLDPQQTAVYDNVINKLKSVDTKADLVNLYKQATDSGWAKLDPTDARNIAYKFLQRSTQDNLTDSIPTLEKLGKMHDDLSGAIDQMSKIPNNKLSGKFGVLGKALGNQHIPFVQKWAPLLGFLAPGGFLGKAGAAYGLGEAGPEIQQALVKGLPKGISKFAIPAISQGVNKAVNSYSQGGMIPDDVKNYVKKYATGGNVNNAEQIEPGIYGDTDPGHINQIVNGLAKGIGTASLAEMGGGLANTVADLGENGIIRLGGDIVSSPEEIESKLNSAATDMSPGDKIQAGAGKLIYNGKQPGITIGDQSIPDQHLFTSEGVPGLQEGSTFTPNTIAKALGDSNTPPMDNLVKQDINPLTGKINLPETPVNKPLTMKDFLSGR